MSELHKFLFDGLPVRGSVVRLTEAWQEILKRRAANTTSGAYALPVQELLGEMTAAGVLMQSNIKFNGALVFQIYGDGPVKLAVTEVQSNLSVRSTVTVNAEVPADASLTDIALTAGYPDSTHFSHSIRQFYGLKPSDILAGSRRIALHDAAGQLH